MLRHDSDQGDVTLGARAGPSVHGGAGTTLKKRPSRVLKAIGRDVSTPRRKSRWVRFLDGSLQGRSVVVFYRSMAAMLAAGVHIDHALNLLSRQEDRMADVSGALFHSISQGHKLSSAMAQWPQIFSPVHQRLIQVAEVSASMDLVLHRLADYEESRRRVALRVKSALTYPLFVFALSLAVLVLLPPFLFDGLFKLIETFGVEMPLLTRIVLFFTKLVSNPLFIIGSLTVVVAAIKLLPRLLAAPQIRSDLTRLYMRIPFVGRALRIIAVTRFTRTMEIMSNVGIPYEQSLPLAFDASCSPLLMDRCNRAVRNVLEGETLCDALRDTKFFSEAFLSMVKVGEESGRLATLFSRIADMYEMDLTCALDTMMAALEPVMLIVMGVVVGTFVLATMLPMVQVIRNL